MPENIGKGELGEGEDSSPKPLLKRTMTSPLESDIMLKNEETIK